MQIQCETENAGECREGQNKTDPLGLKELGVKETEPVRALIHLAGALKFPRQSEVLTLSVLLCCGQLCGLSIYPRGQGRRRDKRKRKRKSKRRYFTCKPRSVRDLLGAPGTALRNNPCLSWAEPQLQPMKSQPHRWDGITAPPPGPPCALGESWLRATHPKPFKKHPK